jgi:anti-sigma regulatory factor (Ser/Thr protein kinase)
VLTEQFEQGHVAGSRADCRGAGVIRLRLPDEPGSVPLARRALVEFASRHRADPEAVAVAVSEAVGNAVLHGYRDGASGSITIEAWVEPERGTLLIAVTDDGVGMSPNPESRGIGLGLPLIHRFATSAAIEQPERGTRVLMRFALGRGD